MVTAATLACAAAAAGAVGCGQEEAADKALADQVQPQLRYLDPGSSLVAAVDLRYEEQNGKRLRDLISQGLETGLVSLKGNTWSYGEHKAVGREKFKALISSDPIVRATLENDVRAAHDLPPIEVPAAPAPAPVRTARKRATRKKASA